jgi:arylsulfatase A-like enzyme
MTTTPDRRRSLVLVTVDCLRADHTGFLGYPQPTTPFLDGLAKESVVVTHAIAAGSPTYYSFPAIMASRFPLALGRDVVGLAPGETSLATLLADAGYRTAAFNAGNVYLSARSGYQQGFELFCDFLDAEVSQAQRSAGPRESQMAWYSRLNRGLEQASRRFGPAGAVYDELYFRYCQWLASRSENRLDDLRRVPPANVLVDQALTWLRSVTGQPFFLWLHLMDCHHPYYPPIEAVDAMGRGELDAADARYLNCFWDRGDLDARRLLRHRDAVVGLYDAGVRWVDMQLARLVDGLVQLGAWADTTFAITADHGEEFLDHGGRYHAPVKLTEELIRVPLLLRVPGQEGCRTDGAPFSLLHLAPTLLQAVGVAGPDGFCGQGNWDGLRGGKTADETAIVEVVDGCTNPLRLSDRIGPRLVAVRDSRYKLVFHFCDGREELFDLEADPGEHAPLLPGTKPRERKRLLEAVKRHVSDSSAELHSSYRLSAKLQELRHQWQRQEHTQLTVAARTGT